MLPELAHPERGSFEVFVHAAIMKNRPQRQRTLIFANGPGSAIRIRFPSKERIMKTLALGISINLLAYWLASQDGSGTEQKATWEQP